MTRSPTKKTPPAPTPPPVEKKGRGRPVGGGGEGYSYSRTVPMYADIYQMPQATIVVYKTQRMPLDEPIEFAAKLAARPGNIRVNMSRLSEFVKNKCATIADAEKWIASSHKKPGKISNMSIPGHETTKRRPTKAPTLPKSLAAAVEMAEAVQDQAEDDEIDTSKVDGLDLKGLERELHRVSTEMNEAYKTYVALAPADPISASAAWKTWKEMLGEYTKLSKAAPDIELRAKTVVKVEDVREIWMRAMAEASTELNTMARRVSTHPAARNAEPVDLEQLILAEVAKVMTAFHGGSLVVR